MKKILCMFMAFVLCVLICTETTVVKTAKAENVPTAITFGPVSFELPDGWDAINYDASDLGYSERLMFEFKDYVSRRMTLVPAEEMNACFFIEYGDAWEYTIKCMEKLSMPVDMYEESDQENLCDCLADVSLMISIFERFADTYGIPYENISVGKTDQYDYACMTYNPSALLPELKEMGYESQILSCAVCADGYCVWLHLVPLKGTYSDYPNVLNDVLNTLNVNSGYSASYNTTCGPVKLEKFGKWEEFFRESKTGFFETDFISDNPNIRFSLCVYDLWQEYLLRDETMKAKLNGKSRNDVDSIETAINIVKALNEKNKVNEEIRLLKLNDLDFCEVIFPKENQQYKEVVTCACIDGYFIYFNCDIPIPSQYYEDYQNILNTIEIVSMGDLS